MSGREHDDKYHEKEKMKAMDVLDQIPWPLCLRCIYSTGIHSNDMCEWYNMPLKMVGKKKKCKHFEKKKKKK
jgi:hypothetical protein